MHGVGGSLAQAKRKTVFSGIVYSQIGCGKMQGHKFCRFAFNAPENEEKISWEKDSFPSKIQRK